MSALHACHNRKPFQVSMAVQDGWIEMAGSRVPSMTRIPFRNTPNCEYSLSPRGLTDPACDGCKWRQGVAGAAQAGTEST